MERIVSTRASDFNLTAQWMIAGEDLIILVSGGEKAHIGAVAIAEPRLSLNKNFCLSANVSVFCYLGHKEENIVHNLAKFLSASLGVKVVVAAGIHWSDITPREIKIINDNAEFLGILLLRTVLQEYKK